jgi:hypothetical protein
MNSFYRAVILPIVLMLAATSGRASSVLPWTGAQNLKAAGVVFRGQVTDLKCHQDADSGHIHTVATLRVDEVFKGRLPATVRLDHVGGTFHNRSELDDFAPQFKIGAEYLIFASQRTDGSAFASRGGASVFILSEDAVQANPAEVAAGKSLLAEMRTATSTGVLTGDDFSGQGAQPDVAGGGGKTPLALSTATNLLVDANNIAARHTSPDRGEPIPYLIDADYLPAGISQTNAVLAVQEALSAWTAVTSLKYSFMGIQSFGMSAASNLSADGVLRIQLHDHYGYITGSGDILGRGGYAVADSTPSPAGWLRGGNVKGNDFYRTLNPFLVIASTNAFFNGNVSNLAEVVCHEVGHTIGLAHSSNTAGETNSYLASATMYYAAHGGGRGAVLGAYDPNAVQQIQPTNNYPPYMYDRYMYVISSFSAINNPNVNVIQLRGYSVLPKTITLVTNSATANDGNFSLSGINLKYTPKGAYSDNSVPPASNSFFDQLYARFTDGTNASPYATVDVISFGLDSYAEGVPDSWRTTYFGNANPASGANHHATNDADGDGYSNLQEYQLGSNPTNKNSNLEITYFNPSNLQWQAKPYEVYEIYGSTNLSNWVRVLNPQIPTNTTGVATGFTNGSPYQFFRVEKVP